ncbi:steroid receptor RNA activator 1-like [Lineus longissimus]|uniref:steroid receptor RNA activator 1-like n=1 Tax=Lineus longissimus TaxID=88925 RepID=UPI002B4E0FE1
MAETRPGNHERGWNDPPVILHNPSAENRTPKKNLLNKRVAYPAGSSGSGTVNQSPGPGPGSNNASTPPTAPTPGTVTSPGLPQSSPAPPKPAVFSPASNSTSISTPKLPANSNIGDEVEKLGTVLEKLEEIQIQLKPRVQADIKKRLTIFQEFWKDGKISSHVKLKMMALAQALEARNCDEAHTIHLGLMLDYTNEVGQWMVGIKKLIYETRSLPKPVVEQETVGCVDVNGDATNNSNSESVNSKSNAESSIQNPTTLISNPETAVSKMEDVTLNSEVEISNLESVSSMTENPEDKISADSERCSEKVESDLPECDRVSRSTSESTESGIGF